MQSIEVLIVMFMMLFTLDNALEDGAEVFWKDEGRGIYVIDNFSTDKFKLFRKQFILSDVALEFRAHHDDHAMEFSTLGGFTSKNTPKKYKTKYLKGLMSEMKSLYGVENLYVSMINDRVIERNDFNPIQSKCWNNQSEYISMVVLNKNLQKNDYGDIALYNDADEIINALHPRSGRVVLMKCGTVYKLNPPALRDMQNLWIRYIEYSTQDQGKISTPEDAMEIEDLLGKSLPVEGEPVEEKSINYYDYLTKRITTKNNNKSILVFDNLVPENITRSLYDWAHNHMEYFEPTIEIKEHEYRGTNRLADLRAKDFPSTDVWSFIKKMITYISGKDTYYFYDKFFVHGRRMTHMFVHTDGITEDKEWTAIIYLNPNWDPDLYGETLFLENNNLVGAVVPRYGRLVFFDGSIEHTSRAPSPNVSGARFSYVVKTSSDKESATIKSKREKNCCDPWDPPIV